jgi:hypothetical protein
MSENVNLAAPGTGTGNRVYWLWGIAATLGLAVAVLIATVLFGQHGGEEFCPDTFTRRSFFYFQIPLIGIQVTPIFRDDTTNSLENYLVAGKFLTRSAASSPRWDLVTAFSAGSRVVRGDAQILCSYLDMADENGRLIWQRWTDTHSEAAKVLWPCVAQLARRQLYLLLPELFELAHSEADSTALAEKLDQSLAGQYQRLAEIQTKLGNRARAAELQNYARQHGLGKR